MVNTERLPRRGRVYNYLGMELTKYIENMINKFPVELGKKDMAKMPASDNLFNLGTGAKLDTKKRSEIFHTFVAK
jgi:hypothetical protein